MHPSNLSATNNVHHLSFAFSLRLILKYERAQNVTIITSFYFVLIGVCVCCRVKACDACGFSSCSLVAVPCIVVVYTLLVCTCGVCCAIYCFVCFFRNLCFCCCISCFFLQLSYKYFVQKTCLIIAPNKPNNKREKFVYIV